MHQMQDKPNHPLGACSTFTIKMSSPVGHQGAQLGPQTQGYVANKMFVRHLSEAPPLSMFRRPRAESDQEAGAVSLRLPSVCMLVLMQFFAFADAVDAHRSRRGQHKL